MTFQGWYPLVQLAVLAWLLGSLGVVVWGVCWQERRELDAVWQARRRAFLVEIDGILEGL